MKQVAKWGSILVAASAVWLFLLFNSDRSSALHVLLPYLPVYAVVALGCYGLGMVGYGLMVFPTCPEEERLLQKDIGEAKSFFLANGLDIFKAK